MLPPLVSGQSMGISSVGGNYQNYGGYRPTKLKSLNNKGMPHGLNGEKMRLNHNPSQDKISHYSGNYGSPNKDPRLNHMSSVEQLN